MVATNLSDVLGSAYSVDHTTRSVNSALLLNGPSDLSSVAKGHAHSVDA